MPIAMHMASMLADERDRELMDLSTGSRTYRGKLGGRFPAPAYASRASSSSDSDLDASDSPARTPRTPRLRPTPLAPLNCSADAATSRAFLSALDRVEISGADKGDDGVTYYLVDTHRFHYTSRIPTNRLRQQLQHRSSPSAAPAFCVRRRYSDFAALREAVLGRICANAMFICPQCAAMEHFSRFGVAQPRLLVRVATGVKQRQHLLKKFLDELMALSTSRRLAHAKDCALHDQLPRLLEAFLTDAWPLER